MSVRITDLPPADALTGAELTVVVQSGVTKRSATGSAPVSAAQQAALDLKAPIASPTFTGTVSGVTKAMVGLGDADNTSDANKPVSTLQAAAIALKLDATHAGTGGAAHAEVVTGGAAGFMTGAQATKLAGIATGATANATDAALRDRTTHTGVQATSTITGLDAALNHLQLTAALGI